MPGAAHRVADQQSFGERTVIVAAGCADGEQLGALPLSLGLGLAGAGRFSLTKTLPSRCSTDQQSMGLRAGAASASPVRRLKRA